MSPFAITMLGTTCAADWAKRCRRLAFLWSPLFRLFSVAAPERFHHNLWAEMSAGTRISGFSTRPSAGSANGPMKTDPRILYQPMSKRAVSIPCDLKAAIEIFPMCLIPPTIYGAPS